MPSCNCNDCSACACACETKVVHVDPNPELIKQNKELLIMIENLKQELEDSKNKEQNP